VSDQQVDEITDETQRDLETSRDWELERRARARCDRMRMASGTVSDPRPLVTFLYLLMRDEVTAGRVEKLIDQIGLVDGSVEASVFTNGWLALHAQDVAARLTKGESS
jgi:hypothetical protein